MTDARLPGRWLSDPTLDGLSDRAFRVFANALMYSAEQGTDGHLGKRSLRLLHPDGVTPDAYQELVDAKLWKPGKDDGFVVAEWTATQSTAAAVEAQRLQNRVRQQRRRGRQKEASDPKSLPVTSRVTPKDRTGEARTGQEHEVPAREEDVPEYMQSWRANPPQKGRVA